MLRVRSSPVPASAAELVRRHAAVGLRSFVALDRRGVRDLFANGVAVRPGAKNVWTGAGSVAPSFADSSTAFAVRRSKNTRRGGKTWILKVNVTGTGLSIPWNYNDGATPDSYFYTDSTLQLGFGLGGTNVRADFEIGAQLMTARYTDIDTSVALYADGHFARLSLNPVNVGTLPAASPVENTFGRSRGGSLPFVGTVAWMAEFARPLSRDEIMWWSTDAPFADDDFMFTPGAPPEVAYFTTGVGAGDAYAIDNDVATFSTEIGSGGAAADSSPVAYSTSTGIGVYVGGSLESAPPGFMSLSTVVSQSQTLAAEAPEVVTFASVVAADSFATADAVASFSTGVTVRSRAAELTDGRTDLLGSLRYRR